MWILDPIDGTKHYVKGNPLYAVSLALQQAGESILGVVYLPEMDYLYSAERVGGATLNGRPLRCAAETHLRQAMACLEVPSRHAPAPEKTWALQQLDTLLHHTQRVRIIGISSIGLCLCASGSFDVYVNLGSAWQHHDVAAAQLIMREAGGQYHAHGQRIIAGPEALCTSLRNLIDIEADAA